MEPYAFSSCGNGYVKLNEATSKEHKGRSYYGCPLAQPPDFGCGYFIWQDELRPCSCGRGLCIARKDKKGVSYKCPFDVCGYAEFVQTKDVKKMKLSNAGISVCSSSSPGPSSAGKGSSELAANCPNCKLLLLRIKILEAKLDFAQCHEDPSQSTAAFQELLMELDGILLDE